MAHGRRILWYDPDPRAILPLAAFHAPRSLKRAVRRGAYEVRVNADFPGLMRDCADPRRPGAWISEEFIAAYTELHQLGYAHSLETYQAGERVGGLYGVALGGLFAGESMFSRAPDASKIALVYLVARLRAGGYTLVDTQFQTEHLARFGVQEIRRADYKTRLAAALQQPGDFFPADGALQASLELILESKG
jgi:leucyl/phenylalanyl-tRNA--protein transferase